MRVITGSARGRRLETVSGNDVVRPTTDKIKESIFNIIQFQVEGRKFLDLFAGSGQLGIEALSRGAKSCVFVDSSKKSLDVIKRNIQACNLTENATVISTDSIVYLTATHEKFDVALLDPPYSKGLLQLALPKLTKIMNDGGTILCESPIDEELPQQVENFEIVREYKYGKIKISLYQHCD